MGLTVVKTHADGSKTYKECYNKAEVLNFFREETDTEVRVHVIDDNGRTVKFNSLDSHS